MDVDETVSVSKGVFVFKNNFKPQKKHTKSKSKSGNKTNKTNIFFNNPWYKSYSKLWANLEENIENLNSQMFSSVLGNLVEFIKNSHNDVATEVPTAALLTGINMPDHGAQFAALSKQIKQNVTPHVACLYSQDCQNLKYLMEHLISQFVNDNSENCLSDEDDEELTDEDSKFCIKKNQLSLSLLQSWYKNMNGTKKKVLLVIIPDFESFNSQILQKFILIASWYVDILPFVFVFGIATSIDTLHKTLPYKVSSKISVRLFNSQPSTAYLNNVLEKVFFTDDCPFRLGGKVFSLFTDIFLFYDLSVSNFIQNIKYAMSEHFCYGNVMALCDADKEQIKHTLSNFSHEDCENARQLMSFRSLVESESYENRIKLLTDDDYLKEVLKQKIKNIRIYIKRLHIFLECLLILVVDLPRAPLGKQVRELYSVAVSKSITKTAEYKECFQLLNFQSKDELSAKLDKIINHVNKFIDNDMRQNILKDFVETLNSYYKNMNNFDMEEIEEAVAEIENDIISKQMDRKQLKEKLLGMSKQQNKPMNKYEKIRKNVLDYLSNVLKNNLIEPSLFSFHEIFFFDDISVQNYIIGTHRSAIHNAFNDPQYYLQCKCCNIPNSSAIKPSMPDICIVYKLHLECGKMINLYDWLQAFLSIVDPSDDDNNSKRMVNAELQARFTQAVAELEYLGFVKSSKRKTDHVARLTWGG